MFIPNEYLEFREAARLLPNTDHEGNSNGRKEDRLGAALASGELTAEGLILCGEYGNEDVEGIGEFLAIHPVTWRKPNAREAVLGDKPSGRLYQDGYVVTPVIARNELSAWLNRPTPKVSTAQIESAISSTSFEGRVVPRGYVAFSIIR